MVLFNLSFLTFGNCISCSRWNSDAIIHGGSDLGVLILLQIWELCRVSSQYSEKKCENATFDDAHALLFFSSLLKKNWSELSRFGCLQNSFAKGRAAQLKLVVCAEKNEAPIESRFCCQFFRKFELLRYWRTASIIMTLSQLLLMLLESSISSSKWYSCARFFAFTTMSI